ncbi:GbsR/MarR family transcriptional regulator [Ancylomarina sp. 16SWW S1-10-2]|uniref:GbsR/MarR family transcriptional regulator n=1 Tax=Ancylomarina sp. 16SWW S1-10-2 TaxID=2499681 RepID=UPI0012AD2387|nr:transcriptional regulator [Ancylomarina sp. 16SWW S1-10-2]MRT94403.1 transcriptional regulator [Ancylomarina sp. 16SWW S1-10-2]
MKNLQELEEQKKLLVERYGLFMEKQEKFAPISARIFATLLINKENGSTFEELVNFLGASKSTISTNLKSLQESDAVDFFTKPGDRKKYFTLNPVGFLSRIEENLKMYKTEHQLAVEVVNFKMEANEILSHTDEKFELSHETPYIDYLKNTIAIIEQLRNDIRTKCSVFQKFDSNFSE